MIARRPTNVCFCTGLTQRKKRAQYVLGNRCASNPTTNIQLQRLSLPIAGVSELVGPVHKVPLSFANVFGGMWVTAPERDAMSPKVSLSRLIVHLELKKDLYRSSSGASLYALHHRPHCRVALISVCLLILMIGCQRGEEIR
jgi:hypothetical protein